MLTESTEYDSVIVGSGPSGVSAASALLAQGKRVLLIDAGNDLSPAKQQLLDASELLQTAAEIPHALYAPEQDTSLDLIRGKPAYGSDFPYTIARGASTLKQSNAQVGRSFAVGGLSNVWGASMLPYRADDIADWPISITDLRAHYDAVFTLMNPVWPEQGDMIDELFEIRPDFRSQLVLNSQCNSLLTKWKSNQSALRARGFYFGTSRLALQAPSLKLGGAKACIYCKKCLEGCPKKLVFNAKLALQNLRPKEALEYCPGYLLDSYEERVDWVLLRFRPRASENSIVTIRAKRAFLACGPIESTGIVLRSHDLFDTRVHFVHSDYVLLPTFYQRFRGIDQEPAFTLSQLFAEILDEQLSKYSVHLQFYGFSEYLLSPLSNLPSFSRPLFRGLTRALWERLVVIQGFFHSRESSKLEMFVGSQEGKPIMIRGQKTGDEHSRLRKLKNYFKAQVADIGLSPLAFGSKVGAPGTGFHFGGSFPMSKVANPHQGRASASLNGALDSDRRLSSDLLGRPLGAKRVHIVDASVLPSIPANTITLTTMANAHRIASESVRH